MHLLIKTVSTDARAPLKIVIVTSASRRVRHLIPEMVVHDVNRDALNQMEVRVYHPEEIVIAVSIPALQITRPIWHICLRLLSASPIPVALQETAWHRIKKLVYPVPETAQVVPVMPGVSRIMVAHAPTLNKYAP